MQRQSLSTKELQGSYSYKAALKKETSEWRLPTVFELLFLYKRNALGGDYDIWSGSPYDNDNALVVGMMGKARIQSKLRTGAVVLVNRGFYDTDFDSKTEVEAIDVRDYMLHKTLPDWHPSFGATRSTRTPSIPLSNSRRTSGKRKVEVHKPTPNTRSLRRNRNVEPEETAPEERPRNSVKSVKKKHVKRRR